MALEKTITLKTNFGDDVTFEKAYIRAAEISGDKNLLNINVFYFKEKNGRFLQKTQSSFEPSLNGVNFFAQAYLHLKTLPEFADAIDC